MAVRPRAATLVRWRWLALGTLGVVSGSSTTAEPPRIVQQVKVYSEPGRFAGWPANHGMWIDAYVSHDEGRSWSFLSTPAPDTGQGNPPALVRLTNGRLCLTYGYRARRSRSMPGTAPTGARRGLSRLSYAATAAARTLAMPVPSFGPTATSSPSTPFMTAAAPCVTSRRRSGARGAAEDPGRGLLRGLQAL